MFADAHCHIADARYDSSRESLLQSARTAGIDTFIQGGVDPQDWQKQKQLAQQSGIYCSFGLHPWFVAQNDAQTCQDALDQLPEMLTEAVALGELGLDYLPRWDKASLPRQRDIFQAQLEIAKAQHKPLVLHIVQAHGDALDMLKQQQHPHGGIVHGFAGSYEIARQYLDLGLTLSIGTGILQKGYKKLKDAVARLPLERLVVESDAPDGNVPDTDWPYNEPLAVLHVASRLAEIHNSNRDTVLAQSTQRVRQIFNLE